MSPFPLAAATLTVYRFEDVKSKHGSECGSLVNAQLVSTRGVQALLVTDSALRPGTLRNILGAYVGTRARHIPSPWRAIGREINICVGERPYRNILCWFTASMHVTGGGTCREGVKQLVVCSRTGYWQ
jgi:hypothetical protein